MFERATTVDGSKEIHGLPPGPRPPELSPAFEPLLLPELVLEPAMAPLGPAESVEHEPASELGVEPPSLPSSAPMPASGTATPADARPPPPQPAQGSVAMKAHAKAAKPPHVLVFVVIELEA